MSRRLPYKDTDSSGRLADMTGNVTEHADRRQALRDNAAFFLAGLVNNVVFVVYLSAAEDLLQNSAGVILLASVLPGLLTKMALPLFAHKLSYGFRVSLTSLSLCACCLGVALFSSTQIRLVCIGVSSCAGSLGEVTYLSLSSLYRPSTIGAWSSGTGFAGVSGSFIYHFLRSYLSLSSRQAILVAAPFSLGMLVSFYWMLTVSRGDQSYALLGNAEDGLGEVPPPSTSEAAPDVSSSLRTSASGLDLAGYDPVTLDELPSGGSRRRAALPWLLREYILPLMLVYFFEYIINQGISPTLDTFLYDAEGATLSAAGRSHLYTLYQTAYQSGVFVSRSSIEIVKFPRIWVFPFLQLANCTLLLAASLFGFLPHRYVVFCIMFFEGLVGGGMYVNAFYKLRRTTPMDLKAWALGAAGVGDALGVTFAAIVNIFLECGLRLARGEPACHAVA